MEQRGWSLRDLERESGVSYETIRGAMGDAPNPTLNTMIAIATALGTTYDQIWQPEPPEKS